MTSSAQIRAVPVAAQQPPWDAHPDIGPVRQTLTVLPELVRPWEIRSLLAALARVERGAALLLHVGECAELFSMASPTHIDRRLLLYRRLADRLAERSGREVVLLARMAGQHAKPRSQPYETLPDGSRVLTYRGDAVNGVACSADERAPEPVRLLESYGRSHRTLDYLRRHQYLGRPLFVSHEALLRDYEEPLTRDHGVRYAASAHLVWIGDRTRGAVDWHINWAASIANPVAVKLGPTTEAHELTEIVRTLNCPPVPGRLGLIARMGVGHTDRLRALTGAVSALDAAALWVCDPMHGNTIRAGERKTRLLRDMRTEITAFVAILGAAGIHPAGLHLEVTPDQVRECGADQPDADPGDAPPCDPRLNPDQATTIIDHFAAELAARALSTEERRSS
ncbi:3-deoxy-7-phosphoheptulonate synthase [Nocardia brasiliensis]